MLNGEFHEFLFYFERFRIQGKDIDGDILHFTAFGEEFANKIKLSGFSIQQYIPKKEFEKMLTRVERERKAREEDVWRSFCSVTSAVNDDEDEFVVTKQSDVKVLTDDEIQSVIQSVDKKEIMRRIPSSPAPFFGPARKLGKNQENC